MENEENPQTNYCQAHSGFDARLTKVEDDTGKQWTVLDKLRNRPPVWVTAVIALLTGLLGSSLGAFAMYANMIQIGGK